MPRCTRRTADGALCNGKAVRGTDPPRCMVHSKKVRDRRPYRPRIRHGYDATQRQVSLLEVHILVEGNHQLIGVDPRKGVELPISAGNAIAQMRNRRVAKPF